MAVLEQENRGKRFQMFPGAEKEGPRIKVQFHGHPFNLKKVLRGRSAIYMIYTHLNHAKVAIPLQYGTMKKLISLHSSSRALLDKWRTFVWFFTASAAALIFSCKKSQTATERSWEHNQCDILCKRVSQ